MRALVWTVPGLVWMALACGGGVPPEATAPDEVPEKRRGARERPTDAPEPPRSGVDSVSESGCEAVERGLVHLFTAAPTRANDGEICTVTSRGEVRKPRALTSLLIRALKGWVCVHLQASQATRACKVFLHKASEQLCRR